MSGVLRVASVGLGWWSDELAKAVAGRSDRLRIVACTSRSAEKREAFAQRFGARAMADYEEVLAAADVDAVLLTTPHSLHAGHAFHPLHSFHSLHVVHVMRRMGRLRQRPRRGRKK